MSENIGLGQDVDNRKPWWREPEIALIIVVVVLGYFVRIGAVSMRGEEPAWAHVAFGMIDSGDWIVPRSQGEPFLSRPPLQNWLIAASSALCGSREAWAVRLPSVLAMLATALLIYGYGRTFLSRSAALAAALAFPTFGEMFTTGAQAETDMLFTFLVSASLLLWHWGQVRPWPALRTWIIAYSFVALAILCKGPQPPVYFLGAVGAYLVLTGQWRRLFSWAHLAGIMVGAVLVLAWLVPCILSIGWPKTLAILTNDSLMRFRHWIPSEVALHLLEFPLEVLGCTLPWSLLIFSFLNRNIRGGLGQARLPALFMGLCVGVAFPTIWLPPNGNTRYLTPLYPCLAVLIGIVVEGCLKSDASALVRNGWRWFTQGMALIMTGVALTVLLCAYFLRHHPRLGIWAEAPELALGFAAAGIFLAVLVRRGRQAGDVRRMRTAVVALAAFMVLTFTGYITNVKVRASVDQAGAVARLKQQLPPGQRLVSFGPVDLLFPFYFGRPIDRLPVPTKENDPGTEPGIYFCFYSVGGQRPALPFAWEELAAINMDRHQLPIPEREMIIGRRVPAPGVSVTVNDP